MPGKAPRSLERKSRQSCQVQGSDAALGWAACCQADTPCSCVPHDTDAEPNPAYTGTLWTAAWRRTKPWCCACPLPPTWLLLVPSKCRSTAFRWLRGMKYDSGKGMLAPYAGRVCRAKASASHHVLYRMAGCSLASTRAAKAAASARCDAVSPRSRLTTYNQQPQHHTQPTF